jgi:F0F1-type ATP synthase alpha subunit
MSSTETQLRASEIKDVLLREIEQYSEELKVEEVGEVLEVKDGVARIYGLTQRDGERDARDHVVGDRRE